MVRSRAAAAGRRRTTWAVARRESKRARAVRTREAYRRLREEYPDSKCALHFRNPLELLVATILSAQCTDVQVNKVTPELFRRYPEAAAYAAAELRDLERRIHSTGFFRNKAKSLKALGQALAERHDGRVPATMEELVRLPGVGRKTANVVLGNAFGIPGVVVDTHVKRLSRRLGLTAEQDPDKIEQDLMKLVPRDGWTVWSHLLIDHGRRICKARKPECGRCVAADLCPSAEL